MEAQRWDAQRKTTPGPAHGPKPRMETYPIAQNILRRQSGAEPRTTADRKERREGREECIPRPEILAAFCPKRKIAPRNLARGDFHLLHFTALDSRHFLPPCTTSSREAAGREGLRALARRRGGCAYLFSTFFSSSSPTLATLPAAAAAVFTAAPATVPAAWYSFPVIPNSPRGVRLRQQKATS